MYVTDRTRRAARLLAVALSVVFVLGACSEDTSVGSGVNTEFEEKLGDRLGEGTTTSAPPVETSAPTAQAVTSTTAPRAQARQDPTTTTTAKATPRFTISITSSGFDPVYIRVRPGTIVEFANRDSQERSVAGDQGEFDTGPIAPGAAATFVPDTPGKVNFTDGTRPFVVGTIEVVG